MGFSGSRAVQDKGKGWGGQKPVAWESGVLGLLVWLWVLLPACASPRFYCYLEYPSLLCHSETTTPNLNNKYNFLILHSLSTSTDLVLKRHYHKQLKLIKVWSNTHFVLFQRKLVIRSPTVKDKVANKSFQMHYNGFLLTSDSLESFCICNWLFLIWEHYEETFFSSLS